MSPLQTDTLFLLPFPLHSFIENIAIDPLSYTSILSMQFSLSPDDVRTSRKVISKIF